jgi:hypothetical protein
MNGEALSTLSVSAPHSMGPPSLTGVESIDPSAVLSWLCQQCPLRRENNMLRTERGYWRSQDDRVKAREEQLLADIKEAEAKLKLREDQLFGRKSEVCPSGSEQHSSATSPPRKRGQQPGAPGHGRNVVGCQRVAVKRYFSNSPHPNPASQFPGTRLSSQT